MATTFHIKLVNGRFGDPALYLQCFWEKRALLFDLGEINRLRPSEILKVSDVFITHTHIDHFVGFDHFLRIMLNRDKTIRLYGPEGLIANIAGKLAGYTWNLADDYRLRLQVHEVASGRFRRVTFACQDRFRRRSRASSSPYRGVVMDEERFVVEAKVLDHSVPCLGFALREKVRLNINKSRLSKLGWEVGPWLGRLKTAIREGRSENFTLRVPTLAIGKIRMVPKTLKEVASEVVLTTPGMKLAYVTDLRFTPENVRKVTALARDADLFFCEAAFLERDADHARKKNHLTARQAGELARRSGARKLNIFHFSPKYLEEEELLQQEATETHRMEHKS